MQLIKKQIRFCFLSTVQKCKFNIVAACLLPVCVFLIIFLPRYSLAQNQTEWSSLPAIDSYTTPAVCELPDHSLHAIAIAGTGIVAHTKTETPGGWSDWEIIGPYPTGNVNDPAFYADPFIPPVLLQRFYKLWLIACDDSGNLNFTSNSGAGWSPWQKLTADGPVDGKISATLTVEEDPIDPTLPQNINAHLIFKNSNNKLEYRRYYIASNGWFLVDNQEFDNSIEGTLGSDGEAQLILAIRTANGKLHLFRKISPWIASWKTMFILQPEGTDGEIFDVSNIVYFDDAFHLIYAAKLLLGDINPQYTYQIEHLRVPIGDTESYHFIAEYIPGSNNGLETHPKSTIIVYRNKLLMAYADPQGFIRYSRWDNADHPDPAVSIPWIGNEIIDSSVTTAQRPALCNLNRRPLIDYADYGDSNFGNDLVAVISQKSTHSLLYINFSRAIFAKEMANQFSFYNSNSDDQTKVCRDQEDEFAPALVDETNGYGRPFFTEIGYVRWTLPSWIMGDLFRKAGKLGCYANNPSGRFEPPCDNTRYPVIIRAKGGSFICNGVWVHRADEYKANIFHELIHSWCGMMGWSDDDSDPLPTSNNENQTGIPLTALIDGYDIFGTDINSDCLSNESNDTCPNSREVGFADYANNYDVSSRQHSFIGALTKYVADGEQYRTFMKSDLQQGNALLYEKYQWIKQHIFSGAEFRQDNEPVGRIIPLPAKQNLFAYTACAAPSKSKVPSIARPIGVGYIAEGGNDVSLEVGTYRFEEPMDLYFLVVSLTPGTPIGIFTVHPDSSLQPISAGLVPWISDTKGPVNRVLFGDIPKSIFPKGIYILAMLAVPVNNPVNNYMWVTNFIIP